MSKENKTLTLMSTAIGCLGTANVIILGIYITNRCLRLAPLFPNFLAEAIITTIATLISAAMLLYGSYIIYKDQVNRGGMLNILAGMIMVIVYTYYAVNWKFSFLMQPTSYLLLIPAPISGILGILTFEVKKQKGHKI